MADYETDTIIQTSLRTELGKDVTLLTVAHRLQTIMDADKIVSPGLRECALPVINIGFASDGPRCWPYCKC